MYIYTYYVVYILYLISTWSTRSGSVCLSDAQRVLRRSSGAMLALNAFERLGAER